MIHNYPYSDFHELNLDYIMSLALSSLGIHLEVSGQYLKLINAKGEEISKVVINYADTATHDELGNDITAYIISAGINDNAVVFTKGDGTATSITIPYAVKADQDINGNTITSYVKNVSVSGDQLTITFGDGSTASITIPYAVKARDDVNGKSITSYASVIATVGDKLVLRDGNNNTIVEITVSYSVKASQDEDGDIISATYATALATGDTTVKLTNKDGDVLNEITVPYAVKALKDNNDNEFLVDYAYNLNTNGNKVTIESHTGRTLNEITVPFSSVADHSNNSIETVEISGDRVVFTTYLGRPYRVTIPYAHKALSDNLNNVLSATYVANVTNDPNTGKISFFAQDGTKIAELTPTVDKAVNDSYNNLIADYIKSIVTDPNSNYMTVLHGTGDADTIMINYATHAYKDTYDNVIGNTYIRNLAIEQDPTDNKYYLVAYNGELSELFRIIITADQADKDSDGNKFTSSYGSKLTYQNDELSLLSPDDTVLDSVELEPIDEVAGMEFTMSLTAFENNIPAVGQDATLTYDNFRFYKRKHTQVDTITYTEYTALMREQRRAVIILNLTTGSGMATYRLMPTIYVDGRWQIPFNEPHTNAFILITADIAGPALRIRRIV